MKKKALIKPKYRPKIYSQKHVNVNQAPKKS